MRVAALIVAAACSNACLVVSLQPAYDDESIVFEERLIGSWENVDDGTAATIDRGEWRSYKIVYTDRSARTTFQGNLTKIGDWLVLDLTQSRGLDAGPYLVPVHGIYRIRLTGDMLSASAPDYGWFTRAMAARKLGRLALALDSRRNITIAAPTSELRAWLSHAPDEAFTAAMIFTRRP
jgi:hypothetical protein